MTPEPQVVTVEDGIDARDPDTETSQVGLHIQDAPTNVIAQLQESLGGRSIATMEWRCEQITNLPGGVVGARHYVFSRNDDPNQQLVFKTDAPPDPDFVVGRRYLWRADLQPLADADDESAERPPHDLDAGMETTGKPGGYL